MKIIKEVQSKEVSCAWYGQFIEDIKMKCRDRLRWKLQFTPGECNMVAHKLDKFALQCEEEIVWMEDSPEWLKPCIQVDKMSNSGSVE